MAKKTKKERLAELKKVVLDLHKKHGSKNVEIANDLNAAKEWTVTGKEWNGPSVQTFKKRFLAAEIAALDAATSEAPLEVSNTSRVDTSKDKEIQQVDSISVIDAAPEAIPQSDDIPTGEDTGEGADVGEDVAGAVEEIMEDVKRNLVEEPNSTTPENPPSPPLNPEVVKLLNRLHESGELTKLLTRGDAPMIQETQGVKRHRFRGERVNSGLLINRALKDDALKKAKSEGLTLSVLVESLLWGYLDSAEKYVDPAEGE